MKPLAGIGLKDAHALPLLQGTAAVDFIEVHAENCLVAGGPRLRRGHTRGLAHAHARTAFPVASKTCV